MGTTSTERTAAEVAVAYFDALNARDLDGAFALWQAGSVDHLTGRVDLAVPDGAKAYFAELFSAVPDFRLEVKDVTAQDDRVAIRWTGGGTFAGPGRLNGFEPTGTTFGLQGCDVLTVRDGRIVDNEAYVNEMGLARDLGALPAVDSAAERRMAELFNRRTRLRRALAGGEPERIADGVHVVRGGFPQRTMNVYFIEHPDGGVVMFDAGISAMTQHLRMVGTRLGGLREVVLGHAHPDHRGAAPGMGVPVRCHPADREDAEGDGGMHYVHLERLRLPTTRWLMPKLLHHWDGGPVRIDGTVEEDDEVAGFRVVHVPGHAPGQIALFRERDGVALTTDAFYTLDVELTRKGEPRVPHPAYNHSTEQAQASIRKLAALEPTVCWPGHADPVVGDCRRRLERAADTVPPHRGTA